MHLRAYPTVSDERAVHIPLGPALCSRPTLPCDRRDLPAPINATAARGCFHSDQLVAASGHDPSHQKCVPAATSPTRSRRRWRLKRRIAIA